MKQLQGSIDIACALFGHENDKVGLFDDIGIFIVQNRVSQGLLVEFNESAKSWTMEA